MKLTNKGQSRLFNFYAFLAYAIPMTLLFIFNNNAYKSSGSIVGFWGIVLFAFVVIAFREFLLKQLKNKMLLTLSIVWLIISLLMRYFADKMLLISFVSFFGALLSTFVTAVGDAYEAHAYKIENDEKVLNLEPAIPFKQALKEAVLQGNFADKGSK